MPNYKCHLVGGLCAYLIVFFGLIGAHVVSFATAFEWLLFALAGALFPDIDIKSKGQKLFYWIVLLLMIVLLARGHTQPLIIIAVLSMLPLVVRHRGIFHRLWFIIFIPVITAVILCHYFPYCHTTILYDCLFFIAGAISHLWLDLGLRRMLRW